MIEIKNLNKYYNSGSQKFHALKDINLTFPEKGFYFITGKSGSGKSTLLNIIGGIDSYDSGDLIINNLNVVISMLIATLTLVLSFKNLM